LLVNGQELQAISQDGTSRLTGSAPAKQLGFEIKVICQQSSRDLLANHQDLPAGSQDIPSEGQDCQQSSRDLPRPSSHQREKHSRTSMLSTIKVYFIPFVPNFFFS
jgi:hypothetical protein